MTTKARGPRVIKGALVSVDDSGGKPRVIAFQYNPHTLKRTLQPQMVGGEENDRSQAVRFSGAPVQTISVEVEMDATDQLDKNDATARSYGILPQLAALELLAYPTSNQVSQNESLLSSGVMEVAPMTAPRTLFVWGRHRVLPVRLLSHVVTEELFDTSLNPIQATVALEMRVLNYSDLDSSNKEYSEFRAYQQTMESMERMSSGGPSPNIGVKSGQL